MDTRKQRKGKCSPGQHPRTGTRAAASCVRSTMRRRTARGPCGTGTIYRAPYVRRTHNGKRIFVKGNCIADVGAPGKGLATGEPGIGPLRSGDLAQFGYDAVITMSEPRRHLALAAAVSAYGSLTVWRKLNAVYVYTRRTSPASSRIFKADRDWIKTHYGIRAS
jgi:hypothetical protein